ncbi:hypothetical protein RSSM_05714 [Rhodopirellula sallentina SM41]|uniref:Uncharacterized protein n=1 Tax=Rhodopirellula sallentina SM41 TaxID=1263870 RepID=M5TUY4_9BACT|nr:hypothetical protein RSSM_05714 [Rhodopirellula sallentina SM41]
MQLEMFETDVIRTEVAFGSKSRFGVVAGGVHRGRVARMLVLATVLAGAR